MEYKLRWMQTQTSAASNGDITNRYNEVSRVSVLAGIRTHASIDNTLAFRHAMMAPSTYVGMGRGTVLVT